LAKRRTVLASGIFDLIHLGHVRFLEKAKEAGGEDADLLVVVGRDETMKKTKGSKPVLPAEERRALVEALKPVDRAVLGREKFDIGGVIQQYKPDIIALGYDQHKVERMVRSFLERESLPIQVTRIQRFGLKELNSSSKIKKRIVRSTRR